MKLIKKIALGLLAVLVLIQLVPVDRSVPEYEPNQTLVELTKAPESIQTILKNACNDCHSYDTNYPWYSKIAPVSWWIQDHIKEGRSHLNFSIWGSYKPKKAAHKMEECAEDVGEGKMPMNNYTWMHSEAKLSDAQLSELITWFETQEKLMK